MLHGRLHVQRVACSVRGITMVTNGRCATVCSGGHRLRDWDLIGDELGVRLTSNITLATVRLNTKNIFTAVHAGPPTCVVCAVPDHQLRVSFDFDFDFDVLRGVCILECA